MRIIERWHGPVYCDAMLVMVDSAQTVTWSDEEVEYLFGSHVERRNWNARLVCDLSMGEDAFAKKWFHGDKYGQIWLIERVR